MTNEEAQELIAELKKEIQKDVVKAKIIGEECYAISSHYAYVAVEKIINRFANKPPEDGYVSTWSCKNERGNLFLKGSLGYDYILLFKESGYLFSVNKHELKELRDNINKMLEYLDK